LGVICQVNRRSIPIKEGLKKTSNTQIHRRTSVTVIKRAILNATTGIPTINTCLTVETWRSIHPYENGYCESLNSPRQYGKGTSHTLSAVVIMS